MEVVIIENSLWKVKIREGKLVVRNKEDDTELILNKPKVFLEDPEWEKIPTYIKLKAVAFWNKYNKQIYHGKD